MSRRIFTMILAFCLIFTLMGVQAQATQTLRDDLADLIPEKTEKADTEQNEKWTDQEIGRMIDRAPAIAISPAAAGDREINESEPNDTVSEADIIKHDYTVYGETAGDDLDAYIFELTETSHVTVVSGCSTDGLVYIALDVDTESLVAVSEYLGQESSTGAHMDGLAVELPAGTYCLAFMDYYEASLDYFFYIDIHAAKYTTQVVAPTCATEGYTVYSCTGCDYSYNDNYVPALGHDYTSEVLSEAICMTNGQTAHTCTVCGDYYIETVYAPGHNYDYDNQTTLLESTCTEKGTWEAYCKDCGDRTEGELPVLDHDYSVWTPAWDGTTRNHVHKCSRCDSVEKTESCTFDAGTVVTEATRDEYGTKEHTCTVCGGSYQAYSMYRVSGSSRSKTAFEVADELKDVLAVDKFEIIILASGENFADALAGSYLAAVKNAPILLYRASAVQQNVDYITQNLADGGTVYILGGTASVSQEMEDILTGAGITVKRLAGSSRYNTNLEILKEVGIAGNEILVSTALNFADSLSASATGKPILLVNSNSNKLTDAQVEFLSGLEGINFTIIGGTSSVSEELAAALEAYGAVGRVSGTSREKTSVAVAERYFTDPDYVLIAYSQNFPDGLCGGPLAYSLNAPLLLTNAGKEAPAADYVAANGITKGIILGGTNSISDGTVQTIFPVLIQPN